MGQLAYMETALEFSVTSELYANHFVNEQAHKVEGLRHSAALIPDFSHGRARLIELCLVWYFQIGRAAVFLGLGDGEQGRHRRVG